MMRNLKIGMVLAVALAMSAIGVSSALASSLDVGANPATLTGEQGTSASTKVKLTITTVSGVALSTIKCTTASLDGTTSTTSVEEATLTPSYGAASTCELGGLAGTVSPGSCKYTISGVGKVATIFDVSITGCTSTLTIVQGACTLSVPSTSAPLSQIKLTSMPGAPDDVVVHLELTKIPLSGGAGCPANLQGSTNTGDLSGTYTVKAYSDPSPGVEGSQVSLTAT